MKDVVRFTPLGDLVTIVMGQAPSSKDCNFDGRGTPFVKAGEFGARRPIIREWTTNPLKHARKTDVLLCVVGATCGKLNLGEDCAIGRSVAAIRPEPTKLDQFYLHYFLMTLVDRLRAGSVGAAQTVISKEMIQSVTFPWREVPEQRRIVAILDEAFEGIATAKANAERNLHNAHEAFFSYRDELMSGQVGWLEAPLANLCDVKHGYAFEGEFFAQEGKYVLLTPGSFHETGGYRERGSKTKYFIGPIPSDYILDENALLVAMTEQAAGLLGSPLLVPEANRFLHNQRLGLVKAKPGVPWANEFFFHVFNVARVRQEIHASASGVKVRHTSPGKIGSVRVAYPSSLEEQRLVASRLFSLAQECEQLADIQNRKLAALDELKKSLLHQAFTGRL